jgi:2-polyprenyl-3-methyl-5-hydroxy-6-metoxy-1,4-benzoquinol methylase
MEATPRQRWIAHAVYSRPMLATYDLIVLQLGNRFATRCPTGRILDLFDRHVTANHLDVGVGTGYFLDKCRFPSKAPRVALMDINLPSLNFAGRRLERYAPEIYQRDLLEPLDTSIPRFDSISCNYLLHCLPGTIAQKGVVLERLAALLNPGGVLFGATILARGADAGAIARVTMFGYNVVGIFANREDDLAGLRSTLETRFERSTVESVGAAALFAAWV